MTKTRGKVAIKSSTSPLGGGSVRVYVGDSLVWTKRVKDLAELLNTERAVTCFVYTDDSDTPTAVVSSGKLRLV